MLRIRSGLLIVLKATLSCIFTDASAAFASGSRSLHSSIASLSTAPGEAFSSSSTNVIISTATNEASRYSILPSANKSYSGEASAQTLDSSIYYSTWLQRSVASSASISRSSMSPLNTTHFGTNNNASHQQALRGDDYYVIIILLCICGISVLSFFVLIGSLIFGLRKRK